MWTYAQSTGQLYDPTGEPFGTPGYSGHPPHVNDASAEADPNLGPIPAGDWQIVTMRPEAPQGPFVLVLAPKPDTNTFGRSGFLMHGDLVTEPGQEEASLGCIIMPRSTREAVWASQDRDLVVVTSITPPQP
jgi:Tlde1 domain